jgi:hypothetical protein
LSFFSVEILSLQHNLELLFFTMIYKIRVIFDSTEDVFRDIAIEATATLEDLHNTITQSFGFEGNEMASFYLSDDDWEQGDEIPLFDMSEGLMSNPSMSSTTIETALPQKHTRMLYVYDFLSMWTFFVEVFEIEEPEVGVSYPAVAIVFGQLPDSAPDKEFIIEKEPGFEDGEDDLDNDAFDEYDYYN